MIKNTKDKKEKKVKASDKDDNHPILQLKMFNQDELHDLFNDSFFDENNETTIENEKPKKSLKINKKNDIQFVEKYRPKTLDDIVQQDEIIKVLKNTIETGELPHLIFHGPSGTGKTSTILALVMELFGPKIINDRVIELNASDERGIGIVRNKIISFTKIAVGSKDERYPSPNFKIVILDEADAMTPDAQEALRKIMEKKSSITRFCFICNYINEIIDPIVSRCMQFKFKPLDKVSVVKKITQIAKSESIKIDQLCSNTIYDMTDGDLRRAIMVLQNTKYLINHTKKISSEEIIKFTGGVESENLKDFWKILSNGNCIDIKNLTMFIQRQGYQVMYIVNHLKKCLINSDLSDYKKSLISLEICKTDKMLIDGCDEYIQILNILLIVNNTIKN
jgi:replication factor C subunit 2/4